MTKNIVQVLNTHIGIKQYNDEQYISLTDIARYKNPQEPKDVVKNRLRLKNTIEYLWLRERINNPHFKGVEFDPFRLQAGTNTFTFSLSTWIEKTCAIGLKSKVWRYGWWTFAHKDIAIKFANRVSIEFELYLIKEFQRLKEQELKTTDRNVKRFLTKMNYKIHTDAIKNNLIPTEISLEQISFIYADEADILNVALFGQTAKQWTNLHPNTSGNMRDDANIEQLIVLANLESLNAEYIKLWLSQAERIQLLNQAAIGQMTSLMQNTESLKHIIEKQKDLASKA